MQSRGSQAAVGKGIGVRDATSADIRNRSGRGFRKFVGGAESMHGVAGASRKGNGNVMLPLLVNEVGCTSMDQKSLLIRLLSAIVE